MPEEIRIWKDQDNQIHIEQANDVVYCTVEQAINLGHRLLAFAYEADRHTEEVISND